MYKLYCALLFLCFSTILLSQQTVGLFQNDAAAYNGYTLIAPSGNLTYLIDNCGLVVNTWESDYPPGLAAYLLDDGRLLRTARIPSNFAGGGTGGRIELFDWEGNLTWSYNYSSPGFHQHHDVEYLPNGNILVIAWELRGSIDAVSMGRNPQTLGVNGIWSEQIVELKPVGTDEAEIVWEWHLWDHLIQDFDATKFNYGVVAAHPELVNLNFIGTTVGGPGGGNSDWIHMNSIDYNAELDQIIVSSRNFSEFWIIDHSTNTAEAAGHTGGDRGRGGDLLYRWGNPQSYDRGGELDQQLFVQHDVHWIEAGRPDEGSIMVFNNGANRPNGNFSSVEIITPPIDNAGNYMTNTTQAFSPMEASWLFATPGFFSSNISGAGRLPNGNTLICSGRTGHIFELTPDLSIAWEYINPVSNNGPVNQGDAISVNSLFRAYRYGVDYGAFTNRDLTPGAPIELNPTASDCTIFNPPVAVNTPNKLEGLTISPNPFAAYLEIKNDLGQALYLWVYDATGHLLQKQSFSDSRLMLSTAQWEKGLYFLFISDESGERFILDKVVKGE